MKKLAKVIIIALTISMLSTSIFAYAAEPNTQQTTQMTAAELKISQDKEKDVKKLIKAEDDYNNKKISADEFISIKNSVNKKYTKSNNKASSSSIFSSSLITPYGVGSTTYGVLNIPCAAQEKSWYCGPASAYNIFSGQGITYNSDGRALTQYNLAYDLGALTEGARFPGTWSSTMTNWGLMIYAAREASVSGTKAQWKSDII